LYFRVTDNVADYLDAADFEAFGFPNQTSWCPLLRDATECSNVTFVQLMSMSSGLIDGVNCAYAPGSWEIEYCPNWSIYQTYPGSIASVVGVFINRPLSLVPGSAFHYTNENFMLCSYLIEKISGLSLREYIQVHITNVLEMDNTYFDPWDGSLGPMDNMLGTKFLPSLTFPYLCNKVLIVLIIYL
jgi:CubicO group peptidase (beta-lactamase class C family)